MIISLNTHIISYSNDIFNSDSKILTIKIYGYLLHNAIDIRIKIQYYVTVLFV